MNLFYFDSWQMAKLVTVDSDGVALGLHVELFHSEHGVCQDFVLTLDVLNDFIADLTSAQEFIVSSQK